MEDLCSMMEGPSVDSYDHEHEYDDYDSAANEGESCLSDVATFGMALGLAEIIAEENEVTANPETLVEEYEDDRTRVSLQNRHSTSKVPIPAFEQYVDRVCGL